MVPPFVPSDATVGVVPGERTGGGDSMGTGDAPGGELNSSHVNGDMTQSSWRREAILVGGGPYGDAEPEEKLLPASSSDLFRLMENLHRMPTGHGSSCWW